MHHMFCILRSNMLVVLWSWRTSLLQKRFIADPDWPFIKDKVLNALQLDEDDYQDIKEDVEDYFQEKFG